MKKDYLANKTKHYSHVLIEDQHFINSLLVEKHINKSKIHRVSFENCSLEDWSVKESSTENILFDDVAIKKFNLINSSMENTKVKATSFTSCSFLDDVKISYCDFTGKVNFFSCIFNSVTFEYCTFKDVYFQGCALANVRFENCTFVGSYSSQKIDINDQTEFHSCRLDTVTYHECKFLPRINESGIQVLGQNRFSAEFTNSNMVNVHFNKCSTLGLRPSNWEHKEDKMVVDMSSLAQSFKKEQEKKEKGDLGDYYEGYTDYHGVPPINLRNANVKPATNTTNYKMGYQFHTSGV